MSDGFPKDRFEALALLYVQSQDLSEKSPEDIHDMYLKAYYAIKKDNGARVRSNWFVNQEAEQRQP